MNWYLYHKNGRLAVVIINEHHQNNTQYMYFWLSLPSSQPMGNDSDISLCLSINSGACQLTLISLNKFWYLSINYDICLFWYLSINSDISPSTGLVIQGPSLAWILLQVLRVPKISGGSTFCSKKWQHLLLRLSR